MHLSNLFESMSIKHGFFDSTITVQDIDQMHRSCIFICGNQTHDNNVVVINEDNKSTDTIDYTTKARFTYDADALVTNLPNVGLFVYTADCAPILLCDKAAGVIAAVHAGWRGAFSGIIRNAAGTMVSLGASPGNILAALGPCIRQPSYQVQKEFMDLFIGTHGDNNKFFTESEGQIYFDLPAYCMAQLYALGIERICNHQTDTYIDPNLVSYRRNKTDLRNISAIWV